MNGSSEGAMNGGLFEGEGEECGKGRQFGGRREGRGRE